LNVRTGETSDERGSCLFSKRHKFLIDAGAPHLDRIGPSVRTPAGRERRSKLPQLLNEFVRWRTNLCRHMNGGQNGQEGYD